MKMPPRGPDVENKIILFYSILFYSILFYIEYFLNNIYQIIAMWVLSSTNDEARMTKLDS